MNIKVDNKKITFITIGVVALIAGIFGVTYAWFDANVTNPDGSSMNIATANLGVITFTDGPEILLEDMYPGTTETKEFTIARTEATSDTEVFYQVMLYVRSNTLTAVADGEFTISLMGSQTGTGNLIYLVDAVVPESTRSLGTGSLIGNETHTYTFEIKLNETGSDQNSTRGMGFNGYLQIEGYDSVPLTNEACFNFDSGTGAILGSYSNEGNNPANIPCPFDIKIPSQIGGVDVEYILDSAFENMWLTNVDIPNTVTSIGSYAFNSNYLRSVSLGSSVVSIGEEAFSGNDILYLSMKDAVETIGYCAFCANELGELTISDSVTSIGESAFAQNNLTHITIPSGVTFGSYAFEANQITSVTFENGVTTIPEGMFSSNLLTNITLPSTLETLGDSAFYDNDITSVTIPNSVTTIGAGAFYQNALISLVVPSSVTSIGNYAFAENQIASLTLPSTLTTLGAQAFDVNNLTSVIIPTSLTALNSFVFGNNQITGVTIPTNITVINSYAFYQNALTSVCIKGKSNSSGFTTYGSNLWGWANGYSDSNIIWNCPD